MCEETLSVRPSEYLLESGAHIKASKEYRVLAINPGSTSTKIAVYSNETENFSRSIDHSDEELAGCGSLKDQFNMRKELVLKVLEENGFAPSMLSAVVGRGGMLPPVNAGGYTVNEAMKRRIIQGPIVHHASNLGALLAAAVAEPAGIPAYIYDAVSSDELKAVAKITGIPEIERQSFCHVLNSKAMARKAAERIGKRYEDMNYIVAHLGGGISVSAHEHGKIVDVITDDAGPFSPERAGSVPLLYIVDMCYSGEYSKKEILAKLRGMGGLKAYLGTHDCREIERRIIAGDVQAKNLYEAQAYQISKGICELLPALSQGPDGIILTGGVAYSGMLTDMVTAHVKLFAPVLVMPGENELESLALGALRILRGEEGVSEFVDDREKREELFV